MAEFCYECFNETFGTNFPKEKLKMSKELELCEGCAQYKHVVVKIGKSFFEEFFEKMLGR